MTRVVPQLVPDLGEFRDVEIIDVLVKAGDTIDVDSPLITLETDKATMDVPATAAGVVQELKVAKGQGHNLWEGFFQSQELVDFVLAKCAPAKEPKKAPAPAKP